MSVEKAQSWLYAEEYCLEPARMAQAREQASELGIEPVSVATGNFLATLAAMPCVKNIAEIGTGTGVSGLYLLSSADDTVLTTIDLESEAQTHARDHFAATGIRSGRYRVIHGRSADILPRLAASSYDLVFVDGDPLEAAGDVVEAIRILRSGGVLVLAHALYNDRVADPARRDDITVALRNLGKDLAGHEELRASLIPLGDGLIVAVKH
ncbi:MAG: methyltransferase [Actinomycetaceae bacterium]|nr:methyltransferase [Actinomycetaceae bacterium]